MILRKVMYASGEIRAIYLEFPETVESKISKAIIDNSISSIKKIVAEHGGRIYSKLTICKLKLKGDKL